MSVKDLVGFIHATGDLASQSHTKRMRRMGQKLHAERQAAYRDEDRKEALVRSMIPLDDYEIHIQGRIDGVLERDGVEVLEEIKSTDTPLELVDEETFPAHMAQLELYGYMWAEEKELKSVTLQLVYIHHKSREEKVLKKRVRFATLKEKTKRLCEDYLTWLKIYEEHQFDKMRSIEGLAFPFEEYREGQYHFAGAAYKTLVAEEILFATAPTGVGKTAAAIYSGLKSLKDEREKLFYLTAKNAGKTIAVETVERMKAQGLSVKAITLNSKENMCLMVEVDCDPELCPYAKGFYNRVRKALEDIFVHDDVYEAKLIKSYGEYHTVCPHEFALEIANYADIVICDFNYVFDPRIRLIRFFEESAFIPKLLVDEAHNLVERARAMHSARIGFADMAGLFEAVKKMKPSAEKAMSGVLSAMENMIAETDAKTSGLAITKETPESFVAELHHLAGKLDALLEANKRHKKRKAVREGFFLVAQFLRVFECWNDAFRFAIQREGDDFFFDIICLDASGPVSEVFRESAKGAVLFSATLKPLHYYKGLLTKGEGSHFEVPSPFDPERLGLFLDVSTSTKFRERPRSVARIIDTIYALLETKKGNYIAFFPSYAYMQMVYEQFDASGYVVMKQERGMGLFEREDFITSFKEKGERSKILFSVLGGSFSEAVDYKGEALSGVLVVGVALPAYNRLNEILKDYFYEEGYDGFDFAYTYPGMTKVVQAVGRVIRSQEDEGVAVLFDTRYATEKYKHLMPSHWRPATVEREHYIQDFLRAFWEKDDEGID